MGGLKDVTVPTLGRTVKRHPATGGRDPGKEQDSEESAGNDLAEDREQQLDGWSGNNYDRFLYYARFPGNPRTYISVLEFLQAVKFGY